MKKRAPKLSLEQIVDANPYATIAAGISVVLMIATAFSKDLALHTNLLERLLIELILVGIIAISLVRLGETARFLRLNHLRKLGVASDDSRYLSIGVRYLIAILVGVGLVIIGFLVLGGGLQVR